MTIDFMSKRRLSKKASLTADAIEAMMAGDGSATAAAERACVAELKKFGLSETLAESVIKIYGTRWREALLDETFGPYVLIFTFKGKWPAVDAFARKAFSIANDADLRVSSALHEVLNAALLEGHCYVPLHSAVMATAGLLKLSGSVTALLVDAVLADQKYPFELDGSSIKRVLLRSIADNERLIADAIRLRKLQTKAVELWQPCGGVDELSPEQLAAVMLIQSAGIGVVTGGPGTGKTTSLQEACLALDPREKLALCAPTGKAARRMTDATGQIATTIHRLLKYDPRRGFIHDATNPLDLDVVIVDESSMLDIPLAAALFAALRSHTRVIFVGDVEQLPPVGPGAFFRDLIASDTVPVVRLVRVHRQAAGSWVAVNAPKILSGEPVDFTERPDFEFWETTGEATGLGEVVGEVLEALYLAGVEPQEHVILTPRKTPGVPGSTADLNGQLQQRFNPSGQSVDVGMQVFRVGDRVIQTRNDYDRGVMNGDLGVLTGLGYHKDRVLGAEVLVGDITPRKIAQAILGVQPPASQGEYRAATVSAFARMVERLEAAKLPVADPTAVENQPRTVIYSKKQLYALQLGYALTIHKSQGSEWPVVIVICHSCHSGMLTRKLLYTALTRASQKVVLIGDKAGVASALASVRDDSRRTLLRSRLCAE
jgi:exodeoxyribonuclease V alpha subunit